MCITRHHHESPLTCCSMARSFTRNPETQTTEKLTDRVTRRKWPVHLFFIFISACFSGPDFERWPSLSPRWLFWPFLSNFIFLFKALSIRESIYFFISKENESVCDVLSRPVFVLMLYESYERVGLLGFLVQKAHMNSWSLFWDPVSKESN